MVQRTPDVQGRPSASGSPATADLNIPSVFGADRVDILNIHKLLFCFELQPKKPWSTAIDHLWLRLVRSHIRFCETDKPEELI
jgi:hypothetical protein